MKTKEVKDRVLDVMIRVGGQMLEPPSTSWWRWRPWEKYCRRGNRR